MVRALCGLAVLTRVRGRLRISLWSQDLQGTLRVLRNKDDGSRVEGSEEIILRNVFVQKVTVKRRAG